MHFIQVFCAVLAFVTCVSSKSFGELEGKAGNVGYGPGRVYREGAEGNGAYGEYSNGVGGNGAAGGYSKGLGGNGVYGEYTNGAGGYSKSRMFGIAGAYGAGVEGYGFEAGECDDEIECSDPQPYSFSYAAPDEMGHFHYREEQGDTSGTVIGSYGYTDEQGLYREVNYVADADGFRASIKTNEPGVDDKESPADVSLYAEQPPAGIQEKYTQPEDFENYGADGMGKEIRMNGESYGIGGGKFGGNGGFGNGMDAGGKGGFRNGMDAGFSGGFGNGNSAGANKIQGGFESSFYGNRNQKNGDFAGNRFGLGSFMKIGGYE